MEKSAALPFFNAKSSASFMEGGERYGIAKQKYGITVNLDDIRAEWSDKEQKVKIHLELDAEMPKADLMDILKKAGIC